MTMVIAKTLDLKGLACPLPVVRAAKEMEALHPDELIEVLATDPRAAHDFAVWAKATRADLLESSRLGDVYRFVLKKK